MSRKIDKLSADVLTLTIYTEVLRSDADAFDSKPFTDLTDVALSSNDDSFVRFSFSTTSRDESGTIKVDGFFAEIPVTELFSILTRADANIFDRMDASMLSDILPTPLDTTRTRFEFEEGTRA